MIFVFGSNREGRHGKGAALAAVQAHGAIYGQGEGLQGNSYAIPTKRSPWEPLLLSEIQQHVNTFIKFAQDHPELSFQITPIGTGYAGYSHDRIKPMFQNAPNNCHLPIEWR